jgi:ABC-type thiamine transport system ATPase subunit
MRHLDLTLETKLDPTPRVKQLSGMFDVPPRDCLSHRWKADLPIDERDWNVGLIVGPSGAGKSSVARELFGDQRPLEWRARSVIDDFDAKHPIADIAAICQAVGFNTVPSWMKPFGVLSTGERFRVEVARRLLEDPDPVVVDEFTSVVDRQVAHIGSHAVQKYVRKNNRRFVAVTCHFDVVDWLQPDWVFEPATAAFQWRSLQRRPELNVAVAQVDHSAWRLFAPFHYLTKELHKAAQCFVLFVDDAPASFIGILHMPHAIRKNLKTISRAVTLPDYQGMGLVMALESKVCGAYRAFGFDVRGYPAHPSHIRSLDRSPEWKLIHAPGQFGGSNKIRGKNTTTGKMGGRPCAVFEFVGKPLERETAAALLGKPATEVAA